MMHTFPSGGMIDDTRPICTAAFSRLGEYMLAITHYHSGIVGQESGQQCRCDSDAMTLYHHYPYILDRAGKNASVGTGVDHHLRVF